MKALILVGGFGTRLRPLTLTLPKPMVPFCNEPMVVHQMTALAKVGVKHIILAVNYRADIMENFCRQYEERLGIEITISQETEPLGTAGPLALARDVLKEGGDECFFVLNSDVICEFPFQDMLTFHKQHGAEGTIFVTKVDDPSKYGVVVSKPNGEIIQFVEKPSVFVSNRINAGLYLFETSMLDRIELRPTSIEKEIFPLMAHDSKLFCMDLEGFWMDVGQPKDYLLGLGLYLGACKRHEPEKLATGDHVVGNVIIHETATIGENCVIGPDVCIGKGVVIEDGVCLKKCSILENSTIKSHSWIRETIVGWGSTVGRWCRLDGVTVLGEDVNLKDEIYVNGAKVLPHKSISNDIPEPQIVM
ncbi:mannose-1-phosphate guanyltransferase beta [Sphaeroforma arctica JP610]|uniref:mannose-1-phosphate guanylyltransferase n=1 Tax=Sphaeroforma arctica JP610 TaxID=667725 RepID=A0A0L0FUQ7_9EUKA|nr:mannose-1-phosphate guanyltransferase beta [Sphaeroforma arctica JP610]KNC79663.1 mannose-1-phosphate guanyltransferase beta [Sphaeroforma arctica JP610]|eukprot:XP_014153565.1 mannose-1-phosphate guanyltransferase beta [Sphaeroforma arctica JP610]